MRDGRLKNYVDKFLVVNLCGMAIVTCFLWADRGLIRFFSIASILTLIIDRYVLRRGKGIPLPRSVFITSLLLLLSVAISAFHSENQRVALTILKNYRFILLAGLLFTAPLGLRSRTIVIIVFFIAAAAAGAVGIAQYSGYVKTLYLQPDGFSANPNFYAGLLAVASSAMIFMLFSPRDSIFASKAGTVFLVPVTFLALSGVILSQSRGMWVALFAASLITLFRNDRSKALVLFWALTGVFVITFATVPGIRQRAVSMVTSFSPDHAISSATIRFELWKGAWMIFTERPLFGVGLGDFSSGIQKLIEEKTLKPIIDDTFHAHNIYLQVLTTQGLIGLAIFVAFLVSLLSWGADAQKRKGPGGSIILVITLLTMIGGLTDNHIEFTQFMSASSLIVGLLGPIVQQNGKELLFPQESPPE